MKPYYIMQTAACPDINAVPVAKLTCFPLEQRDYKPFAQFRAAAAPEGLYLRAIAFEVTPEPESTLAAVIGDGTHTLRLAFSKAGELAAVLQSGSVTAILTEEITRRPVAGEDLQGVYWGADLFVPEKLCPLSRNTGWTGNFYKLCRSGRVSFGSYYPCSFEKLAEADLPDSAVNTVSLLERIPGVGEPLPMVSL